MKEIIFVTGNNLKFEVAQKSLKPYEIELIQQKLETPEIQSTDVGEVASYSAKWACEQLKKPVVVTDGGYYIKALNGFPGPFIKFINKWLTSSDILKLMEGKNDRGIEVRDALGYCEPGKEPEIFYGIFKGKIALKAGQKGTTPINEIYIPEGHDKVESDIGWKEMSKYWAKGDKWQKLAEYLMKNK